MKKSQCWGCFEYPLEIRGPSRTAYREGKTTGQVQACDLERVSSNLQALKCSDFKSKNDLINKKEKEKDKQALTGFL